MTDPAKLTPAEQTTLDLSNRGMSQRAIALHLRISRSAVQSRLENAHRKIATAKKEQAA